MTGRPILTVTKAASLRKPEKRTAYSGKVTAPDAKDREDPRRYMVSLPAVLTVQEAAKYLKVCDEVVYTLVHREDFPGFRIGRIWRIDAQRMGDWVRKQAGGKYL